MDKKVLPCPSLEPRDLETDLISLLRLLKCYDPHISPRSNKPSEHFIELVVGPDILKNGNILELKQLSHVHTAREDSSRMQTQGVGLQSQCSETLSYLSGKYLILTADD